MKFQEKFIFIYHVHLFDKNPSGLHISLNTRPEPLAYMNEDIPVKFGHYIWDHGLEGGQGVMRLFINLSLNFPPHEIIWKISIFWTGRPDFLGPMVLQVGLQSVQGAVGCVLGSQATKSTVLVRPKDLFVLILSWEARFPWTNSPSGWLSPVQGDFGCFLGG